MREAILRAAADLLARHGPPLSLDEVAATVGVTAGHLRRYYFTSVDAVTAALVAELARPEVGGLVGTVRSVGYRVVAADSVRAVPGCGAEFAAKPDIMASGRLIEVCEAPCMEAVRGHLADAECSLGHRAAVEHTGPIPVGAWLVVTVVCTSALGHASDWRVHVHDGYETVAHGQFGFVAAVQADYERRRLAPKRTGHRPGEGR